jgi:hypothetical protein
MRNAGPNVYRHYKGGFYRVLHECVISTNGPDDGKIGVVYVSMTNGHIFMRERNQFHEMLSLDAGIVPRFTRIAENAVIP